MYMYLYVIIIRSCTYWIDVVYVHVHVHTQIKLIIDTCIKDCRYSKRVVMESKLSIYSVHTVIVIINVHMHVHVHVHEYIYIYTCISAATIYQYISQYNKSRYNIIFLYR